MLSAKTMDQLFKAGRFIFLGILCLLPWATPAQDISAVVDRTLLQLNLSRAECLEQFLLVQPVSDKLALVVIPEITAIEREHAYTLRGHVLIVESESGSIVARNSEPATWYSDAFYLYQIEVLENPIACTDGLHTYGLSMRYSVRSMPNPYDTSLLSIWVRQGEKLIEVLTEYPTHISKGETNASNAGEFEVHNRTLLPMPDSGKEWPDLLVVDSLLRYDYDRDESAEERILEQSVTLDTLRFQPVAGKYTWE